MTLKKKTSGIGRNLKDIRRRYGLSLTEVAARTGISRSTLYKVESAGVSLTYDKILQISDGLNIDITELFGRGTESPLSATPTRRSIGRSMEGYNVDTSSLTYHYLCQDLLNKKVTPMIVAVKAHDISEYEQLTRHSGEEFDFVLEGEVDVHTEFYETVRLKKGEFIYLDSMMGHAFVSKSSEDALLLSVCSSPTTELAVANPTSAVHDSRRRKRGAIQG